LSAKARSADVLGEAMREIAHGALAAAAIGLFVNLLYLAVPFYTMQVYNRVITSRSYETLAFLTVLTIGILLFVATLDYIRSRIFAILGERMAIRLGAPVLSAAVATALRNQAGTAGQAVRDL
jgi:ATP-binding cassette, subfamily C, type I secretion system permease/ATPase